MKKFFEKYDLIKIAGILILLSVVLTWVIPNGYFSGKELVTEDLNRIGFTTFFQFSMLGVYYFTVLVTFLFVLGGFYQVLSKRAGYQKLVKNISEKLKRHAIPVVLVISFIFAVLGSFVNEYFPLLAFIPFVITILNRMKVDKVSAFVATFGGLLVGTIGSTYSSKVTGHLVTTLGVKYENLIVAQLVLFALAYILLAIFTVLWMKKQKSNKKFESYDKFEIEEQKESKKAPKTWIFAIGTVLFVLTVVLAYLPWATWNITWFADITEKVNEAAIGGETVIKYIFGDIIEFGKWDIFTVQFVMIFITLLIHWFGRVSLDEIIESYSEGFKKISNVVVVLLIVYVILEFSVMFPVLPAIINWFDGLISGFNSLLALGGAFITSIFTVEMKYNMRLVGTYYASMYADAHDAIAIIFQSAFGFASFFVPSSAILMLGLSYLNIPYKDWMKFIWKFLLAMLVVIIAVVLIVA